MISGREDVSEFAQIGFILEPTIPEAFEQGFSTSQIV